MKKRRYNIKSNYTSIELIIPILENKQKIISLLKEEKSIDNLDK